MNQYQYLVQCKKCFKHNPKTIKNCSFCTQALEGNAAGNTNLKLAPPSFGTAPIDNTPSPAQNLKTNNAPIVSRLVAASIDLIISIALFILIWFGLISDSKLGQLVLAFIFCFYLPALMDAFNGSIGKQLFGFGVLRTDGRKPGIIKMIIRQTIKFLPDFFIPIALRIILFIALKENHIHDWLCKTKVVSDYKNKIIPEQENMLYHEKLLQQNNKTNYLLIKARQSLL